VKAILVGLVASSLSLGLYFLGWPLSSVELALYDRTLRWVARNASAPEEIVLVAIDTPSLQALGS
jgi:CHASE2 domain-containing sensor protein